MKFKFVRLKTLMTTTAHQISASQLMLVASSLAYTTILSIIPLLALSFAIFNAFGGLEKVYGQLMPFILQNIAEGSSDEVIQLLRKFVENAHANALGLGGLLGLILTSMLMLSSVETAINKVWRTQISRSLFQRISAYWIFITLGPLALALILGAATSARIPLSNILPTGTGLFVVMALLFSAIYKWVPNCKVHTPYALVSGVLVAILWNILRQGYQLYLHHAVSYNQIYGSLGAIPILLLWIYIGWLAVLSGAALTAVLQKSFKSIIT